MNGPTQLSLENLVKCNATLVLSTNFYITPLWFSQLTSACLSFQALSLSLSLYILYPTLSFVFVFLYETKKHKRQVQKSPFIPFQNELDNQKSHKVFVKKNSTPGREEYFIRKAHRGCHDSGLDL